jgi:hypothetical protein
MGNDVAVSACLISGGLIMLEGQYRFSLDSAANSAKSFLDPKGGAFGHTKTVHAVKRGYTARIPDTPDTQVTEVLRR